MAGAARVAPDTRGITWLFLASGLCEVTDIPTSENPWLLVQVAPEVPCCGDYRDAAATEMNLGLQATNPSSPPKLCISKK